MEQNISAEELKILRDFKASLFNTYWEKFGTFYIHITPHPNLIIGKRGLIGPEKESGVVLVFGPSAVRDISSEKEYIYAELQFGFTWEKLTIPWDAVYRIYDKNQTSVTQMRVFQNELNIQPKHEKPKRPEFRDNESKVIQVDFGSKKKE